MPTSIGDIIFSVGPRRCPCGAEVPGPLKDCPSCGQAYKEPFLRKVGIGIATVWLVCHLAKEESSRHLRELRDKKWCKIHGFQRTLTLPKDGREVVICIKCLALAMVQPAKPRGDYEKANNLCRGTHGPRD